MIPALFFALGVLVVIAMTLADTSISNRRLAGILALNFVAYVAGQLLTGQAAPWLWFLIVDCVCAFVVLHPPASRLAAVIGSIYVFQIIVHVAFAGAGSGAAARFYLDVLATAGWLQLLTLAAGAIHHGRRRKVAAFGGGGGVNPDAREAHP